VRRIPSFIYGHVLSALLLGLTGGAFLDVQAVLMFSGAMAVSALVSGLVCWRWPGFAGPGWQLWLVGTIANPLFLIAAFFAYQDFDCMVGRKSGWDCLLTDLEPTVMGICLVPPLIGRAVRWLAGRGSKAVKS
jgi:hypothetical protein